MQWGNNRFVLLALVAAAVVVALTGCSGSPIIPNSAAVAIGKQAAGFAGSGPSAGSEATGWVGSESCPAAFEQNERAAMPAGGTLTALDASTIRGVSAVPDLFQGDVPSCAFQLTVGSNSAQQSVFYGMPDTYAESINYKLIDDQFIAGTVSPIDGGTRLNYTKGNSEVSTEHVIAGNTEVFIVIG